MPTYKNFNGKRYRLEMGYHSKTDANKRAVSFRKHGYKVRLVKRKGDRDTYLYRRKT